jgi:hypothetical protein
METKLDSIRPRQDRLSPDFENEFGGYLFLRVSGEILSSFPTLTDEKFSYSSIV